LGATEAAAQLERHLGPSLVPYVVLLLVPLLRRMSDPVGEVRQRVAACFGALTSLLPLAQGRPLPPGLSPEQTAQALQDQAFLEQLLDNKKLEPCHLPMQLDVRPTLLLVPSSSSSMRHLLLLRLLM
jgi:TATA-binding protein-associated factor